MPFTRLLHARPMAALLAVAIVVACSAKDGTSSAPPPRAEFLVSTPDSTFWISTESGVTRVRGVPLVLASVAGRDYEIYSADDDYSYDDALLVGERLYRRDIATGDSALIFTDTIVPRIAAAYARAHPDERPLAPGDDGQANPGTSASAEVDVIDVTGPYVSYEYHVDVSLPYRHPWHTTRRGVIDLRTGKDARLDDLFGAAAAAHFVSVGRQVYEAARDSVSRARASMGDDDRRAADALSRLDFDPRSFALSTDNGALAVVFAVPGHGEGAAGNVIELDPLAADSASWWTSLAAGTPHRDDAGNDRWAGAGYAIIARYDTSGTLAHLSLADSGRREWPLVTLLGPIRRVDWLDRPPVDAAARAALARAFDLAATYDENARVAALSHPSPAWLAVRLPSARRSHPRSPHRSLLHSCDPPSTFATASTKRRS